MLPVMTVDIINVFSPVVVTVDYYMIAGISILLEKTHNSIKHNEKWLYLD